MEGNGLADSSGVYKSEKYVVVERHRYRFPRHCIWCNSVVDGDAAPNSGGGSHVKPPVCATCTAIRNRLPKFVAILGVTMLIAAATVYVTVNAIIAAGLLFAALICLTAAYRLHVVAHRVSPAHQDEQYVWIAGASSQFIAVLPQWYGMKFSELHRRS